MLARRQKRYESLNFPPWAHVIGVFLAEQEEGGSRQAAVGTQQPYKSVLWTICPYILANEFCERLAFYGYYSRRLFCFFPFMVLICMGMFFQEIYV